MVTVLGTTLNTNNTQNIRLTANNGNAKSILPADQPSPDHAPVLRRAAEFGQLGQGLTQNGRHVCVQERGVVGGFLFLVGDGTRS